MRVERYDYASQFGPDVDVLVERIKTMLLGGDYILTEEVARFESEFARSVGSAHCCGLNSGTDALVLAFRALDIGPGDEVVTHANTFYATVAAIVFAGATPVLVDADTSSYLMDVDQLEAAITPRTRAIVPVHLYGKPTPMRPVLDLAEKHGLAVVEDAAQAHGASIDGAGVGTGGTIGCFSFHPSKNLAAAGDGGALVTASADVDRKIRILRNLGQDGQNHHVMLGVNSKLDAIQAAVLRWKMPRLQEWVRGRNRVAERYRTALAGVDVEMQSHTPGEVHAYHLFQVRTPDRDALLAHLRSMEIDAVTRYPTPIHLQAPFASQGWRQGQFPVAESLARELVCLPIRPDMPDEEIEFVAGAVREFVGARAQRREPSIV